MISYLRGLIPYLMILGLHLVNGKSLGEDVLQWMDNEKDVFPQDFVKLPEQEFLKDCIEFRSEPGIFTVQSSGMSQTCGVYFVGPTDTQVAIEFIEFDVDCENNDLIGVLDGWEQSGYIFPPKEDLPRGHLHYETYCGVKRPKGTFLSSGNMALIQYHLLTPAKSFTMRAQFLKNPQPCNMVSFVPSGSFYLRNFGTRRNCSMLAIYPQKITFSLVNVGVTPSRTLHIADHASLPHLQVGMPIEPRASNLEVCDPYREDYVEIRGGNTVSVNNMHILKQLCGFSDTGDETYGVLCGSNVIRLVSSGRYDNVVVVENDMPEEMDPTASSCRLA